MKKLLSLLTFLFVLNFMVFPQVAINTSGNAANASAMLDVTSTNKGILVPRLTMVQRTGISSPATGLLVYDTDDNEFYYYNGTLWLSMALTHVLHFDGTNNTFVGEETAIALSSGSENTTLGYQAGKSINSGHDNTLIGFRAGTSITGAHYNTFVGNDAGRLNTSGQYNTYLGYSTGYDNTAGSSNTLIGYYAGENITGSRNTFLGRNSGRNNISGSSNVFLGYSAGYNETGSNKLYIDNSITSSPLIYGDFSSNLLRIYGTLDINNAYQFPTVDGSNGQALHTNGSGVLSWTNDAGATEINELTDGKTYTNSLFLGSGAGANDGSDHNNLAVGIKSSEFNTVGINNTCIGNQANWNNQQGSENTIIGYQAGLGSGGLHNKAGNVFLGYKAGYDELGSNKLYIENSSSTTPLIYGEFDNDLLRVNGTLDINNAYQFPIVDGSNNQFITTNGSGTLSWASGNTGDITTVGSMTSGDVFSGTSADNQWLGLGSAAGRIEFDNLTTDEVNILDANVGIGTSTPKTKLHIEGGTDASLNDGSGYLLIGDQDATNIVIDNNEIMARDNAASSTLYVQPNGGDFHLHHGEAASAQFMIKADGSTGIGTSAPTEKLTIRDGNLLVTNTGTAGEIRLREPSAGGSSYTAFKAQAQADNITYTLPTTNGSAGQLLETDGSGALSWTTVSGGSGNAISEGDSKVEVTDAGTGVIAFDIDGTEKWVMDGSRLEAKNTGYSVFIGEEAGYVDDLSDNKNIFIGYKSGYSNTSGKENTANGYQSLYLNETGSYNTANGCETLYSNDDGYENTATGYRALYNNGDCNSNVAIGAYSLFNNGTGVTMAGWYGLENTSVGVKALYSNTTGSHNTAIGCRSLYSNISAFYNTANGYQALYTNTTGEKNTATGYESLMLNDGDQNTAIGFKALYSNDNGNKNTTNGCEALYSNDGGNENTATGYRALYNNGDCNSNVAIGAYSLYSNGIGVTMPVWQGLENTSVGVKALYSNDIGSHNTAIGYQSLYSNTSAFYNTANGYQALYSNTTGKNSTALGFNALYSQTGNAADDDLNNTAIGYEALYTTNPTSSSNGRKNVAVGHQALKDNTTGYRNTAIGYLAGTSSGTLHNTTAIGGGASVNTSDKVVIGNSNVTTIGGYASWSNYSDRRLKENIVYINDLGLEFITKLKTASYNYKTDENKNRRDGLIAQDVQQTLDELGLEFSGVIIDQDSMKTFNLSYVEFVMPLINAVQELNEENEELKKEIGKLKVLETEMKELKAMVEQMATKNDFVANNE